MARLADAACRVERLECFVLLIACEIFEICLLSGFAQRYSFNKAGVTI